MTLVRALDREAAPSVQVVVTVTDDVPANIVALPRTIRGEYRSVFLKRAFLLVNSNKNSVNVMIRGHLCFFQNIYTVCSFGQSILANDASKKEGV